MYHINDKKHISYTCLLMSPCDCNDLCSGKNKVAERLVIFKYYLRPPFTRAGVVYKLNKNKFNPFENDSNRLRSSFANSLIIWCTWQPSFTFISLAHASIYIYMYIDMTYIHYVIRSFTKYLLSLLTVSRPEFVVKFILC